jgi:uncharacterized caspase-like protein
MFYFIPFFVFSPQDKETVPVDRDIGISTAMLVDAIRKIKARRIVLVIDACESGGALESLAKIGEVKKLIELRRARLEASNAGHVHDSGFFMIAAATTVEEAAASQTLGDGVLTAALLRVLTNKSSARANGTIWMGEITERVHTLMPEVAKEIGYRQTGLQFGTGVDFPVACVPNVKACPTSRLKAVR